MKRDYLSYSALKAFMKSPNHYLQYVSDPMPPTPQMSFGSALHCWILEPERFDEAYAIAPNVDRRTKQGKADYASFLEDVGVREVITQADKNVINLVSNAFKNDPNANGLLNSATSCELKHERKIDGLPFVGVADMLTSVWCADLKTTQDASPVAFQKTIANFQYHIQAAAYQILFDVDRFYWIAVETKAPFNVAVYSPSQRSLDKGREALLEGIRNFKNWDGTPQGYSNTVIELDLPGWA
jgi:exodeoxyribonuclease VIII